MIADAKTEGVAGRLSADVCVIGAGPAGIVLALELANRGLQVVVLERGGIGPEAEATQDAEGELTGYPYRDLAAERVFCLGGTSFHWGGYCRPLEQTTFEDRQWAKATRWPLEYDELCMTYPKAAQYCGLPALATMASWSAEADTEFPIATELFSRRWVYFSSPTRFGPEYLDQLRRNDHISVVLHAPVCRLTASGSGTEIVAARVRLQDSNEFAVRAHIYCVCCGGIENARLLLESRRDSPQLLRSVEATLGHYFMNHLAFELGQVVFDRSFRGAEFFATQRQPFGADFRPRLAYLSLAREVQQRRGCMGASIMLRQETADVSGSPNVDPFHQAVGGSDDRFGGSRVIHRVWGYAEPCADYNSRVTLSALVDHFGMPRARLDWRVSGMDFGSARTAMLSLAQGLLASRSGFVKLDGSLSDQWIEQRSGPLSHHMGATRMSFSADDGVVDRNCLVHGTGNLYVVGSSVFRAGGCGNPTLTIVALSIRLAAHLASLIHGR